MNRACSLRGRKYYPEQKTNQKKLHIVPRTGAKQPFSMISCIALMLVLFIVDEWIKLNSMPKNSVLNLKNEIPCLNTFENC